MLAFLLWKMTHYGKTSQITILYIKYLQMVILDLSIAKLTYNKLLPLKGYVIVNLYLKSKLKNLKVHRLVAISFIPNPENKPQVNHIDGNKLNNRVSNLEWCTALENIKHAWTNNLHKNARKFDKTTILTIRKIKTEQKISNYKLAKEFGCDKNTIRDIVNNKTYKEYV